MTAEETNRLIAGEHLDRKSPKGFDIKDYLPKNGINSSEMKEILKRISEGLLPQPTSHPNTNAK
jgi:hypothetical protein